jgi:thioredoxin 1
MAVVVAGCIGSKSADTFSLNAEEELDIALQSGKPVLLYFYVDWCPYCKVQSPIIEELEGKYGDRITVLKINADQCPDLLKNYNPFGGLPTIVIFGKEGANKKTYIGLTDKDELEETIQSFS